MYSLDGKTEAQRDSTGFEILPPPSLSFRPSVCGFPESRWPGAAPSENHSPESGPWLEMGELPPAYPCLSLVGLSLLIDWLRIIWGAVTQPFPSSGWSTPLPRGHGQRQMELTLHTPRLTGELQARAFPEGLPQLQTNLTHTCPEAHSPAVLQEISCWTVFNQECFWKEHMENQKGAKYKPVFTELNKEQREAEQKELDGAALS